MPRPASPLIAGLLAAVFLTLQGCSGTAMCLREGTEVATPDGPRAVETLRPGDTVWSQGPDGPAPGVVAAADAHRAGAFYRVQFEDGTVLEATGRHPVRTDRGWVQVRDLRPGHDEAHHRTGRAGIQSIRRIPQPTRVYSLSVVPHENYFANGVLVHNKTILEPPDPERVAGEWVGFTTESVSEPVIHYFRLDPDGRGTWMWRDPRGSAGTGTIHEWNAGLPEDEHAIRIRARRVVWRDEVADFVFWAHSRNYFIHSIRGTLGREDEDPTRALVLMRLDWVRDSLDWIEAGGEQAPALKEGETGPNRPPESDPPGQ